MKKRYLLALGLAPMIQGSAQAQTVAGWDFDTIGTQAAPYNTPVANQGADAGVAQGTQLGMNNNYTYANGEGPGSSASCDVTAAGGASTGSGSYGWRVRGNGNSANSGAGVANGWNSEAPIATQGAEFSASTVGYGDLMISVDIDTTAQAERNLAILYTVDDTAANPIWELATITSAGSLGTVATGSDSSTVVGNYVQLGSGWNNQVTASIGADAANDPNFAVEVVNASTGTDEVGVNGSALNNSSGNWRYDNVEITGTTIVPEPAAYPVLALGAAAVLGLISRKN